MYGWLFFIIMYERVNILHEVFLPNDELGPNCLFFRAMLYNT